MTWREMYRSGAIVAPAPPVMPGVGQLLATGYAPTLSLDPLIPGTGSLILTGYAPSIASALTALRVGLFNDDTTGTGPGGDTGAPRYGVRLTNADPTTIAAKITAAIAADEVLVLNLAGARGQWCVNGVFDWTLYEARVRRFTVAGGASPTAATALTDAIASKRVHIYVVDEANNPQFKNSISPADVNDMCGLHKLIWPGCLTYVRMAADTLAVGWNYQATQASPIVFKAAPPAPYVSRITGTMTAGGWTWLDYGWAQRSGQHNAQTLSGYFDGQQSALLAIDLGMVLGLNWWNGGIWANTDGVTACWATGQGTGFLVGDGETGSVPPPYGFIACGTSMPTPGATGVNRVISSPDWILKWAQVSATYTKAPFALIWSNTGPNTSVTNAAAVALQASSAYVTKLDQAILAGAARATFDGYRVPK